MFSKPFVVGVLAMACVGAAAGGAYVAVRQNEQLHSQSLAATAEAAPPATPAVQAVQETEAVVAPPPAATEPVETPRPALSRSDTAELPRSESRQASNTRSDPARSARSAAPARTTPPAAVASGSTKNSAGVDAAPPTARAAKADVPPPPPAAYDPPRPEAPPSPPPVPAIEELVVPAAAVMGLQIQTAVSSDRAQIEDRVEARVTRDVSVDGRTAIPAGTRVIGAVTLVERGGKVKERARLGVRFHTLVLADGTELPIRTDAILREGESPTGGSTRKIGGAAAGGAILGAIIGGKKGAIIGGATGAAGGTAVVMSGDRSTATLPVGAVVTVRLASPLTLSVGRES